MWKRILILLYTMFAFFWAFFLFMVPMFLMLHAELKDRPFMLNMSMVLVYSVFLLSGGIICGLHQPTTETPWVTSIWVSPGTWVGAAILGGDEMFLGGMMMVVTWIGCCTGMFIKLRREQKQCT